MIKLTHEIEEASVNPAWMFFAVIHATRAIVFLATGKKLTVKWNTSLSMIESLSVSLMDPVSKQAIMEINRVNHGFCNLINSQTRQSLLINLIPQGKSFVHVPSTLMLALFKRDAQQIMLPIVSSLVVGLNQLLSSIKYDTFKHRMQPLHVPFFLNRGELGSGQLIQGVVKVDPHFDRLVCTLHRRRDV
jgi:hypothetical protein